MKVEQLDGLMFHWSPTTRRKQIIRYGLRPGSLSVDKEWKPPYICLAPSPSLGFALCIEYHPEIPEWDLWQVWADNLRGRELLFDDRDRTVKEYRVYERIYKRDIWYVGSRVGKDIANHDKKENAGG